MSYIKLVMCILFVCLIGKLGVSVSGLFTNVIANVCVNVLSVGMMCMCCLYVVCLRCGGWT